MSPVFRFHPGRVQGMLVLCDHASNWVPPELQDLGLDAHELSRHIAWDPGAGDVARRLAQHLDCPWIEHGISRLVADANRDPADPGFILATSDGTSVPGNQALDSSERERRRLAYHAPYHERIDRHLDQLLGIGVRPFVIAVHSFTPKLGSEIRPWQVGVLWRDDPGIARHLIAALEQQGHKVGDNQPYDGHSAMGYTINHHAIRRGLHHTMFELRQDLLVTASARERWAESLHQALQRVLPQHPHQGSRSTSMA